MGTAVDRNGEYGKLYLFIKPRGSLGCAISKRDGFIHSNKYVSLCPKVAELRVTRGGGLFGQITVPFEVRAADTGGKSHDLIDTTDHLTPLHRDYYS